MLITQLSVLPAAIAFGFLGSKVGARRGISLDCRYFSISICFIHAG
jgi:hypothetical protein